MAIIEAQTATDLRNIDKRGKCTESEWCIKSVELLIRWNREACICLNGVAGDQGCEMPPAFDHNRVCLFGAASERFEKAAQQLARWKDSVKTKHIGRCVFKVRV